MTREEMLEKLDYVRRLVDFDSDTEATCEDYTLADAIETLRLVVAELVEGK